ncbi:MAG: serine/threonine-protein kinase [Planctomycetota bacterium]
MTRTLDWFLEFSETEFGIPRDVLERAASAAEAEDRSWHYYAADRGILDSVQASIVQTLIHPHDVLDDYEFVDLLGRGAMGVVYRARQKSLDRIVAIKTILPGTSRVHDRFRVEAQTIAKLQHPNIVTPFEFFDRDGRFFLVLELLEGGTLSERLNNEGAMSERLTWNLMLQTVSGLLYARQHNVVHRDVKPQNLFLLDRPPGSSLPQGVPLLKIADFGLAASIERSSEDTSLTLEGNVVGTPIYMSPEQASDSHVDHRADIYALGATACHMLAGAPMYSGESLMKVLLKKQNADPKRLNEVVPDISKESSELIFEMMARDPEDRPQEYEQLIERIQRLLNSPSESSAIGPHREPNAETIETPAITQTLQELDPGSLPSRSVRRLIVACGGVVILLTSLAFALGWPSVGRRALTPVAMDFSGNATPLFDGTSLEGWSSNGGSLDAKLDYEGVGVLEISGSASRPCPNYSCFVLSFGINLLDANTLTIRLADDGNDSNLVISIARTGATVSGSDDATLMAFPTDPWKNSTMDEPVYRELRIDAEPFRWVVQFDGKVIATLPAPRSPARRLQIDTDEATHFEGMEIRETIALSDKG